ncbi:MAG TPA: glycosyltransferase family 39 protein [Candidatus Woesebacteria bacterium]|nr:glycosyltransferase family 39 protein [Candidatus Woesebacteria bacterium]
MSNRKIKTNCIVAGILLIGIFFRFYQLDYLPADIFGDISENLNHIADIIKGNYKIIYGFDAREGLLFYLTAPFAKIFGNNYLTLKTITASIGVLAILAEYYFVKELTNERVALIAAFLVAVSKWPIIFSRIGFRNILTPMLTAWLLYLFLKAQKTGKLQYFIGWGLITGIGLYSYPAFRFVIISVGVLALFQIKNRKYLRQNLAALLLAGLLFLPMVNDYRQNKAQYTAHINPMMFQSDGTLRSDWLKILGLNIKNQVLMYHVKGDVVFRVNPPYQPALDYLSGVFFIIGLGLWLIKGQYRKNCLIVIIPFLLLQLPSIMVLNFPIDVPSFTRSLPLTVFVYLFIALGLEQLWSFKIILSLLLCLITGINAYNYFVIYRDKLPNHNVSFNRYIANKIDQIEGDRQVFMVGGGWGDWGQPEPPGIRWAIKIRKDTQFVNDVNQVNNNQIKGKAFIVLPPGQTQLIQYQKISRVETFLSEYNEPIFTGVWINE